MARHHVCTQSLETTRTHLAEVAMQNTDVEERRRMDKLEELDIVAAVERRVDTDCKLHLVRFTDVGA